MIRLGLAQVKTCFGTLESPFSSSSAGVSSGTQNFRKWPNPHVFIELRRIARLVSRFVPALSQLSAGTGKLLIIVELRPFFQRFPPNFKKCASIVPQRYPNHEGLALSVDHEINPGRDSDKYQGTRCTRYTRYSQLSGFGSTFQAGRCNRLY